MFKGLFKKNNKYIINYNDTIVEGTENKTILNTILKNNLKIKYNCGVGECRQCKLQLISGDVSCEATSLLACKAYPKSDIIIVQ